MNSGNILRNIKSPQDIKKLSSEELDLLCGEIRGELITTVASNGGHLASNLGVVELTVALHRVFDTPKDEIVWDVGHQCYTHKLLTGRQNRFETIRQYGGISGFTRPSESEHDIYGAGHSSTSISAALGLAKAKALKKDDGTVIAVIGDGSLSGGLAYEGINNAGRCHEKLIIVLNDNKMSISKNVGAMARHLAFIRTKPWYFRVKDFVERLLEHTPLIGTHIRNALVKSKSFIKNAIYHSTIFEDMGLIYLGPVDGHDIEQMERIFERAKTLKRPSLIHVMTVKGKGYSFAENNPGAFHGVSKFDVDTGDPIGSGDCETYSEIFGNTLCAFAKADDNICAITAAMTAGTGLTGFSQQFKDRFFDVGIAEEHAVVFASGLARGGMKPVFAVYSTFLQRAYDQIIHDAALQNLNVVFAIDRAGIVGEDGETHQGIFDVSLLLPVPGMTIYCPASKSELQNNLYEAIYSCKGPAAVRYSRGEPQPMPEDYHTSYGSYDLYGKTDTTDVLIVTYGRMFIEAANAVKLLKDQGKDVCVLKINRIKPLYNDIADICCRFRHVFFFEEGIQSGGLGEHLCTFLTQNSFIGDYHLHAIDDKFIEQGNINILLQKLGLDAQGIANTVIRECMD